MNFRPAEEFSAWDQVEYPDQYRAALERESQYNDFGAPRLGGDLTQTGFFFGAEDVLGDYLLPSLGAQQPSTTPEDEFGGFFDDFELPIVPIPGGNSGGCPFGNAVTGFADQTQVGDVPVYVVSVDVDVTDPQDFETVSDWAFNHAYNWLLGQQGMQRDVNDYAQIRLLRGTGGLRSVWDLVSEMLPASDVLTDFIAAYYIMLQSPKYGNEDRTAQFAGLGLGEEQYRFRITFVLHTADNAAVTSDNIGGVLRFGVNASAPPNSRVRFNENRERLRFVSRSQDSFLSRGSVLAPSGHGVSMSQLADLRTQRRVAEHEIRAGRLPQLVPIVHPAEPRVKRAYKKRRSAEELQEAVLGLPIGQKGEKRVRAAWTPEQRARYNKNRRVGQEVHGLTYDKIKSKLFHHTSIEEFYHFSKAVLLVPNTWSQGYCLAMAFLKSQCRTYLSDGSEVTESKPFKVDAAEGEMYPRIPILPQYADVLVGDCDFIEGDELVLFNPFKYANEDEDSSVKYCLAPADEVIQKWYAAAKNLHLFVETQIGMELDENSEATLQAYADVFGVYISVHNLEIRGQRTSVIKPMAANVDVRKDESFHVVSLLISDQHCSAITCLRAFLRNTLSANRSSVFNYCVFCEKLCTSNNQSKAEATAHFETCAEKKMGHICCDSDKVNRKKLVSDIHPSQFWYNTREKKYICKLCSKELVGGCNIGQIHHVCYIHKPKELKMGDSNNIYVYDFECCQVCQPDGRTFVHEVNLVCVRRVYPDASGDYDEMCFSTLEQFIAYVLSFQTLSRVYLAHNGAKYDVQFIVHYLEKNLIAHHFIPSPGSMHAYLSVTIDFGAKAKATFLDFRHFMPGSLKNIAAAFGLSQQKGDFPHHFNNGANDHYVGCLPALDHAADYWCLESKRSQEEIDEFRTWHGTQSVLYCTCDEECICDKQKWSFQDEIIKYCRMDVNVLAEACARYRDWTLSFAESIEGWTATPIDPFEYLTIPQVAMGVLLAGLPEEENITITPWKDRRDRAPEAIAWMERIQKETGKKIRHAANWGKEFMCAKTKRYLDGVTDEMEVFICLDCRFHGCPMCFNEEIQTGVDHPTRPATYGSVNRSTREFLTDILKTYGNQKTFIVWTHDLQDLSPYEQELGHIIKDREMFKGGRTEVFSPHVNADRFPEDELKYHDVCSLYPFVCAFAELPIGNPEHFCGESIERSRFDDTESDNRYMGFIRCKVRPNTQDKLGLLPCHDPDSGRLEFPLHVMTGTWGTEELRLACQNGYEILEMYEVLHWPTEERSSTVMRGYVSFFLRMKQEAEGWKKLGASCEDPTPEEQEEVGERLFRANGFIARIRPEFVRKDAVNRQLAKLYLNSLWGKFCQKPHTDNYTTIHGYAEFAAIWNDPNVNRQKVSFRYISSGTWKVKYHTFGDFAKANPKYNIYLSSKVTEMARCHLHRRMLEIGQDRIVYCDTDSIIFLWPKSFPKLDSFGLGQWVDELPGEIIQKVHALAPKFYHLELASHETLLKSKGIQMTWTNRQKITGHALGKQLLELFYPKTRADGTHEPFRGSIPMKNMLMGVNSISTNYEYGTMLTKYTEDKRLAPVISKRQLVYYTREENVEYDPETALDRIGRIDTIPKGYYLSVEQMSEQMYN